VERKRTTGTQKKSPTGIRPVTPIQGLGL
jgi:hypothetical protein